MVSPYEEIRASIRPGDVIAFGGDDIKSRCIRLATNCAVSHVAVVARPDQNRTKGEESPKHLLVEATWLPDEKPGVNAHSLEERLSDYNGVMWWLPLSRDVRRIFDEVNFQSYMLAQLGLPFDFVQCLQSATDSSDDKPLVRHITYAKEDLTHFFCSELVAAGLRAGGALRHINCSEITPADICRFALFEAKYVQLKGRPRRILGYNTLNPEYRGYNAHEALCNGFTGS